MTPLPLLLLDAALVVLLALMLLLPMIHMSGGDFVEGET